MIVIGGSEYVTSGTACDRLDIGPETLRNWYDPRDGHPPKVRVLRDPDGRPVRHGRQVLVCWDDAVEAELATRGHGRPRGPVRRHG